MYEPCNLWVRCSSRWRLLQCTLVFLGIIGLCHFVAPRQLRISFQATHADVAQPIGTASSISWQQMEPLKYLRSPTASNIYATPTLPANGIAKVSLHSTATSGSSLKLWAFLTSVTLTFAIMFLHRTRRPATPLPLGGADWHSSRSLPCGMAGTHISMALSAGSKRPTYSRGQPRKFNPMDKPKAKPQLDEILSAVFLPDQSPREDCAWIYPRLAGWLVENKGPLQTLLIPNIYGKATPQFEQSWLMYMESLINIGEHDLVVAHGSSSEAVLRFLETHSVKNCILIDPPAKQLAPLNEGAEYSYDPIKANCKSLTLISLTTARDVDARELQGKLQLAPEHCHCLGSIVSDADGEAKVFSTVQELVNNRITAIAKSKGG